MIDRWLNVYFWAALKVQNYVSHSHLMGWSETGRVPGMVIITWLACGIGMLIGFCAAVFPDVSHKGREEGARWFFCLIPTALIVPFILPFICAAAIPIFAYVCLPLLISYLVFLASPWKQETRTWVMSLDWPSFKYETRVWFMVHILRMKRPTKEPAVIDGQRHPTD